MSASACFPIHRSKSGIRNYTDKAAGVGFIKCMRGVGILVEALIEYVALFQQGDATAEARIADGDAQ